MTGRRLRSSARLWTAAGVAAAVLLAAGCASPPPSPATAGRPAPKSAAAVAAASSGTGDGIMDEAARRIAEATPSSLLRAKVLSSQADNLGSAGAAGALVVADTYLRRLYPGVPGASDGSGISWKDAAVTNAFLQDLAPGLDLLDPDATPDDSARAALSQRLASADTREPSSPLPPFLRGLLEARNGAPLSETRTGFETALRRSATFWPAAAALSSAIIAAGNASSELPLLRQLASLLPEPVDRFEALARAELAGGQPGRAADAAAQGLLVVPEDANSAARQALFQLLRARALEESGDWYQALWVLDSLLRRQPGQAEAQLAKARLLHDKGQNDTDALAVIADGETAHPDNAAFPELEGRILLDQKKPDQAETALKKSLDLAPQNGAALTLLASIAARRAAWDEAGSWMDQIPESGRGPEQLELAWRIDTGRGNHDHALQSAEGLFRATRDPHALALESRSLLALGRAQDARTLIDRTLKGAPAPLASELYYLRSRAGSDDPLTDLRSSLRENPDNVESLTAMADAMAAQKDYRKAMEYARRAAVLSPGDAGLAKKAADFQQQADTGISATE